MWGPIGRIIFPDRITDPHEFGLRQELTEMMAKSCENARGIWIYIATRAVIRARKRFLYLTIRIARLQVRRMGKRAAESSGASTALSCRRWRAPSESFTSSTCGGTREEPFGHRGVYQEYSRHIERRDRHACSRSSRASRSAPARRLRRHHRADGRGSAAARPDRRGAPVGPCLCLPVRRLELLKHPLTGRSAVVTDVFVPCAAIALDECDGRRGSPGAGMIGLGMFALRRP